MSQPHTPTSGQVTQLNALKATQATARATLASAQSTLNTAQLAVIAADRAVADYSNYMYGATGGRAPNVLDEGNASAA